MGPLTSSSPLRLRIHYLAAISRWSGEVDLTHAMNGPVFEPLHDVEFFRQFRVHPEWETLVWPNGADMVPEFLYEHVRVAA